MFPFLAKSRCLVGVWAFYDRSKDRMGIRSSAEFVFGQMIGFLREKLKRKVEEGKRSLVRYLFFSKQSLVVLGVSVKQSPWDLM